MQRIILAAMALWALGTAQAEADIIFELEGVTFGTAGTASGTFTTDDAISKLLSADITTSSGFLTGFEYLYPGSSTTDSPSLLPHYLNLSNAQSRTIHFEFASNLKATGATLVPRRSQELDFPSGNGRYVTSGRVVAVSAVPEPSSLAMLGTAAVAGLVAMRRRKRTA